MNARWIIPFVVLGGALASYALVGGRRRKVVVGGRFAPELVPAAVSLALVLANFTSN
jgi:hypothetical protein